MPSARAHGGARVDLQRLALGSNAERGVLASVFYLAGALLALMASAAPGAATGLLVLGAVVAAAVGVGALFARRSFSYRATLVSSALGPPLIALGIGAGNGGWASGVAAVLYTFVAVHVALVLAWRHAALLLSWGAITAIVAARVAVPELPVVALLTTYVLACGTLAGVTLWLVQQVRHQAATDPLTGLANRAAFLEALEHARATVERTGEPLSLIALDLDGFKQINDTRGHAAGDAVLVAASRAWTEELRERDVLARLGGDEFFVILPGADGLSARGVAERLRTRMPVGTSCSAGVASWRTGQDLDELTVEADRALYAAKARRSPIGLGAGAAG